MSFTLDELYTELSQVPKGDEGWRTVEIVAHLKERGLPHSYKWVNARMNELKALGKIAVGHRMGVNLSDQMTQFTVYRLSREPETPDTQKGT